MFDLKNLNLEQKSFYEENKNNNIIKSNESIIFQLYNKDDLFSLFNIINTLLKIKIEIDSEISISNFNLKENKSNKNENKDLTFLKKLDLLEILYEILSPFYYKTENENKKEVENKEIEEILKELFELIINNVVLKYIELEYLNNPYLYSKKTKNKINSFSDKDNNNIITYTFNNSEFINEDKIINEKIFYLLNNYLNLVFFNIDRIPFYSYLEIIMMNQEDSESIIYMKLNLLLKIIDKFPLINLEENFSTFLEIFLQNMDKNVKIDNVLILCIKKFMNYFDNEFNEKLNKLNNDGIVIQIKEFIKNNIEIEKYNKENYTYDNNYNKENKNAFNINIISDNNNRNPINKANEKEEDLIIIDMSDNNIKGNKNPPLKKSLTNRIKIHEKKENNENINNNNNQLEGNFLVKEINKKEKIILDDSKSKSSKNINQSINEIIVGKNPYDNDNQKKKKFTYVNIDDININKRLLNEKQENSNLFEEDIDPKKKKEKDLVDFEKMLDEQMLLESKKMEEQGISTNVGNNKGILQKKNIIKNETEKNKNKKEIPLFKIKIKIKKKKVYQILHQKMKKKIA